MKPALPKLHIGCGDTRLEGFVNIDVRKTSATDMVGDCSDLSMFDDGSFDCVFAHSFFEHLRHDVMPRFLKSASQILNAKGFILLLGIPNFRLVSEQYLKGGMLNANTKMDLKEVARFTHVPWDRRTGLPDEETWAWMHKSPLDPDEIDRLVQEAGFSSYFVFGYRCPGDLIELSLGVMACNAKKISRKTLDDALSGIAVIESGTVVVYHERGTSKKKRKEETRESRETGIIIPATAAVGIDDPIVGRVIVERLSSGGKRYLEVGVFRGMTFVQVVTGTNMECWGVDRWAPHNNYDDAANIDDLRRFYFSLMVHYGGRCRLLRSDSAEAAKHLGSMGVKFDLIFIDADHTYDGVKRDLEMYWPLLEKNGIFAGHDYHPENETAEVNRAVNEFAANMGYPVRTYEQARIWFLRTGV